MLAILAAALRGAAAHAMVCAIHRLRGFMRALTLFLLTACLASPALAKLELINPPATPSAIPTAAATATSSPNAAAPAPSASGKIRIGYDKRADYPKIKQTLSGRAPSPNAADTSSTPNTQNHDGTVASPAQAPIKKSPFTTKAIAAQAPVAPTPAKPRSDAALRSDSSPARDAAKAAQTEAAAKAAADQAKADAIGAAIAAAQKAGATPVGSLPALPASTR
jgi:hypothetical protein